MSQIRDRDAVQTPPDPAEPPVPERGGLKAFVRQHRRAIITLVALMALVGFGFAVIPQIAGFGKTLARLKRGDKLWLLLGAGFEVLSLGGYIALFRTLFAKPGSRIDWAASYQITLAGVVATKFFAAAGAGGVALTVWALVAAGLRPADVARRMTAFELLLYAVFMGCLVVFGIGLRTGLFPGEAPFTFTVIPAVIGAVVIGLVFAFRLVPGDIDRRLGQLSNVPERISRILAQLGKVPRTVREGLDTAIEVVGRPRLGLLGGVGYWGFDMATLWACFHAFGASPPVGTIVMAYFVGQAANAIPIPGGIGPVEGGMIGTFLAFGVSGSAAVVAVLSYRALSFWLPTIPGAIAYFQLRRTVDRWRTEREAEGGEAGEEPAPA